MKKKVFNRVVLTLVMVATLCLMIGNAFAAGVDNPAVSVGIATPKYLTIKSLAANLSISSLGRASCKVETTLYSAYTAQITMYLQDRNSGWQTAKS